MEPTAWAEVSVEVNCRSTRCKVQHQVNTKESTRRLYCFIVWIHEEDKCVKLEKEAHPDVDCSCKSEDWWGSAYIRSLHQCKNLHLTKSFVSVSSPKINLCLFYVFVIQVPNVCILTHEIMRPFCLLFLMNECFKTRAERDFSCSVQDSSTSSLHPVVYVSWFPKTNTQYSTARRQEQGRAECTLK